MAPILIQFEMESQANRNLVTFDSQDFEVVRRIIELTERRCSSVADRQTVTMSSYRYEGKLNHDASSDLSTLDQKTQKVVDRLALMQAYEATLRNHGLLPVEDSRIYSLLMHVINNAERDRDYTLSNDEKIKLLKDHLSRFSHISRQSVNGLSMPNLSVRGEMRDQFSIATEAHPSSCTNRDLRPKFVISNIIERSKVPKPYTFLNSQQSEEQLQSKLNTQVKTQVNGSVGPLSNLFTQRTQIVGKGLQSNQVVRSQSFSGIHTNPTITPRETMETRGPAHDSSPIQEMLPRNLTNTSLEQELNAFVTQDENRSHNARAFFSLTQNDFPAKLLGPNEAHTLASLWDDRPLHRPNETQPFGVTKHGTPDDSSMFINTDSKPPKTAQTSFVITKNTPTDYDMSALKAPNREIAAETDSDRFFTTNYQHINRNNKSTNTSLVQPKNSSVLQRKHEYFLNAPSFGHQHYLQTGQSESRLSLQKTKVPLSFTSFRTILKTFKAWQAFTHMCKEAKAEKKRLLHLIIKAINCHEHSLMRKSLRGFFLSKEREWRLKLAFTKATIRRMFWTKRFYLRKMVAVRLELQLCRHLSHIAHGHRKRSLKSRVFQNWLRAVKTQKSVERRLTSAFKKNPGQLMVLIAWLSDAPGFNLFEFYSQSIVAGVVRKNKKEKFTKIIQFGIKARMQSLFTGWRQQVQQVTKFRTRRVHGYLRRGLIGLQKHAERELKVREMLIRKEDVTRRMVFAQLIMNCLQKAHLNKKEAAVSQVHQTNTKRKFLAEWVRLFAFYSGDRSYYTGQLAATLMFKRKIWGRFVATISLNRKIRLFQETALKSRAFRSICAQLLRRRNLSRLQLRLSRKHSSLQRQVYFRAIVRGCLIQQRARTYRMFILLTRGMKALHNAVEFRQLMDHLNLLALQHYSQSLQQKAYRAFCANRSRKVRHSSLLAFAIESSQTRKVKQSLQAFQWAVQVRKHRSKVAQEAEASYLSRLQSKGLKALSSWAKKKTLLARQKALVQSKHEKWLQKGVFNKLTRKTSKKTSLNQRKDKLQGVREHRLVNQLFRVWLCKHRELTAKHDSVRSRRQRRLTQQVFEAWFSKFVSRVETASKIWSHQQKWGKVIKQKVIGKLSWYASERIERNQMKVLSRIFFIRKVLTRTLHAWSQTSKAEAMARTFEVSRSFNIVEECFLALKKHYYGSLMIKNLQRSKQLQLCRQIIDRWSKFAFANRRNNDIVAYFKARRRLELKAGAFQAIRIAQSRDSYLRRTFRLRSLFESWQWISSRRRDLARKGDQICFVNRQMTKHSFLKQWRETLFLQLAYSQVAIPFASMQSLKIGFRSLKVFAESARLSREFFKKHTLRRVMKALHNHSKLSIQLKRALRARMASSLQRCFNTLTDNAISSQREKRTMKQIQERANSRVLHECLTHWVNLALEKSQLLPIATQIEQVRHKWQLKLCMAQLKRYTTLRQSKRQMYQSLEHYYHELILQKTMRQLCAYTQSRLQKHALKQQADKVYKRSVLARWLLAKERAVDSAFQLSQAFYQIKLQRRALKSLRDGIRVQNESFVMKDQAALFNVIRLKLKTMRALTMAQFFTRDEKSNRCRVIIDLRKKAAVKLYRATLKKTRLCSEKARVMFLRQTSKKRCHTAKRFKVIKKTHKLNLRQSFLPTLCQLLRPSINKEVMYPLTEAIHYRTEIQLLRRSLSEAIQSPRTPSEEPESSQSSKSGNVENQSQYSHQNEPELKSEMSLQDNSLIIAEEMLGSFQHQTYQTASDDPYNDDEMFIAARPNCAIYSPDSSYGFETTQALHPLEFGESQAIKVSLRPGLKQDRSTEDFDWAKQSPIPVDSPEQPELRGAKSNKVLENIRSNLNFLNY